MKGEEEERIASSDTLFLERMTQVTSTNSLDTITSIPLISSHFYDIIQDIKE
jgi:hypothetical protein